MMPTPVVSAPNTPVSTDVTDGKPAAEDTEGGVSVAVFAGVGGMVVVIIVLILVVTLLIAVLLKKNRNHKVKDGGVKANMYVRK